MSQEVKAYAKMKVRTRIVEDKKVIPNLLTNAIALAFGAVLIA